ncbi:hypothetical protein [Listeria booriae]|uniref:hypothetical protein n=1 Tax=Listeria booriae TaxID=1552123 RepID=UPI00162424DF|nr:hypothetical protein [Listeria booriae]MBC2258886.1 hypothetical protein [Listeria booriae]
MWLEGTSEKYFSINNGKGTVAFVEADKLVGIDTTFGRFERLSDAGKQSLGTLIFEYASTPIAEREESKKYHIKCPITGEYLSKNLYKKNKLEWGNRDISTNYSVFNRAEIDAFEFDHAQLIEEEVPNNER